ncbi:MAG: hypothetical protein MUE61_15400 [Vicinamibacterales bacterium]|jgi:hypothetical protein|nr:hypothetical protein [Vicinamibacterales bacterium]
MGAHPLTLVLQGVALFAFVPLVLWLFLAQPLGPGWSLALGVAIIAGHRAVAAPWAARHAMRRCLWCGRPGQQAGAVPVSSGPRTTPFAVCSGAHERLARQFFGFLRRFRVPIGIGIFAPLMLLLAGTLLRALGAASPPPAVNALQFRVIVAATVVFVSFAYRASAPAEQPRSPFPVHNLFLLGIRNTLWVFRIVGGWWLLAEALRLGGALSP